MLQFIFHDAEGKELWVSLQQPTARCDGGCCFNMAVHDFRNRCTAGYVLGQGNITITTKGEL